MEKQNVIIVDDSANLRKLVRFHLEQAGFAVFDADSVAAGFELICQREIDCIICDQIMPGGNGDKLVHLVRSHDQYVETPILMLSAVSTLHEITDALNAGANAWMLKPYERTQLIEAVNSLIEQAPVAAKA